MVGIIALVVVAMLSVLLFTPRSCRVVGDEVKVRSWLATFTFDLRNATEIRAISNDQLKRAFTIRVLGAGWPLRPFGWFRNSQLGTFLNLVDDPSGMYLVSFPHRKLLVSPAGGMKEMAAA